MKRMMVATVLCAFLPAVAGCGGDASAKDDAGLPDAAPDVAWDAEAPADVPGDAEPVEETVSEVAEETAGDVQVDPGKDGASGLSLEDAIVLIEKRWTGPAGDVRGAGDFLPILGDRGRFVRVSECGDVGVLFRDVLKNGDGTWETAVVLQVFSAQGSSEPPREYLASASNAAAPLPLDGTLTFASKADGCKPRVWRASDTRPGLDLWSRGSDGTWKALDMPLGFEKLLGAATTSIALVHADSDRDGTVHLLLDAAAANGKSARFHAWPEEGEFRTIEVPPFPQDLACPAIAFDTAGTGGEARLFAACLRQGGLYYAGVQDGQWVTEAVASPKEGEEFAGDLLGLSIGSYGLPVIAFARRFVVEGGLATWSRMEVATRSHDGDWGIETVAERRDEPTGAGLAMTGQWPQVFLQSSGGGEATFADLVDVKGELGTSVQTLVAVRPRVASRGPDGWALQTLFRQPIQAQDGRRRDLYGATQLAASPDGKHLGFLVRERERPADAASGDDVESTFRLVLVRATR